MPMKKFKSNLEYTIMFVNLLQFRSTLPDCCHFDKIFMLDLNVAVHALLSTLSEPYPDMFR